MMTYPVWVKNIRSNLVYLGAFPETPPGGYPSCWDELMCRLIHDSDLDNFVENHTPAAGLTEEQAKKLRELRDTLTEFWNRVPGTPTAGEVVDAGWEPVRELCAETAELLPALADDS